MKKVFIICLSLILLMNHSIVCASVNIPSWGDKYSKYVRELESGNPEIDYLDFRRSFVESEQFRIASSEQKSIRELINKSYHELEEGNFQQVILNMHEALSMDYTSMRVHKILRHTYEEIGDSLNAEKYKTIQMGLLKSIVQNGNGKTCETAWPVVQVSEEYFILEMIDAKLLKQSVVYSGETICDQMEVVEGNGETGVYYFNINKIFERSQIYNKD